MVKVEKVVNELIKPVPNSNEINRCLFLFDFSVVNNHPSKKQPTMLINIVAIGNPLCDGNHPLTIYLHMDPKNPPINTINIFIQITKLNYKAKQYLPQDAIRSEERRVGNKNK